MEQDISAWWLLLFPGMVMVSSILLIVVPRHPHPYPLWAFWKWHWLS